MRSGSEQAGMGRWIKGLQGGALALMLTVGAAPAMAQSSADDNSNEAAWSGARGVDNDDLVARGKYLTLAADCAPCHTAEGGKPFAGGLMLNTPFGGLTTPNITPDKATGIGNWDFDKFYRAIHEGIGGHGQFLYPVLPFPSFTKITKADAKAIYTYLQSLDPVDAPRKPSTMSFPFNVRYSLAAWRELFFKPGTYAPDASWPEDVQRGGYLVEALGHCGACHSPRNVMGATETDKAFAGGEVDTFFAPNISSSLTDGIGDWSKQEVVDYLTKGADKSKGSVFGPMEEVVTHSLSKIEPADIEAIAAYLLHTKAEPDADDGKKMADKDPKAGAKLYLNNCAQCHQAGGTGLPGAVPPLAGNGAVTATEPVNVISAVVGGLGGVGSYGQMPSFAAALTDEEIVDVVNYVRTSWGNDGSANATKAEVAKIRGEVAPTIQGSEAAAAFGCPRVSESGAENALADPGTGMLSLMKGVTNADMDDKVGEIIYQAHQNNPSATDAELLNDLVAAYCPVVAADGNLSTQQKHARLHAFLEAAETKLSNEEVPAGGKVLVRVPLSKETAKQAKAYAASQSKTQANALADAISKTVAAGSASNAGSDAGSDAGSGSGSGSGSESSKGSGSK